EWNPLVELERVPVAGSPVQPEVREMNKAIRTLAVLAGLYVAAQMLADIASLRVVTFWGHAVDAGTLIYPFTFTLRDLVHKVGGARIARLLIFLAALINLLMAGFFAL